MKPPFKRARRISVIVFCACFALVSASGKQTATDEPKGRVCGKVVDGTAAAPFPKASVRIWETSSQNPYTSATQADQAGAFCFGGLREGRYELVSTAEGYTGRDTNGWVHVAVVVGAAGLSPSVELKLFRNTTLHGKVVDERGEGLVGVRVAMIAVQYRWGRTYWAETVGAHTDDRGMYRIASISPGDYTIAIKARLVDIDAGEAAGLGAYPPYFLGGSGELGEAEVLRIVPGQNLGPLDFKIRRQSATTVAGSVAGSIGSVNRGEVVLFKTGRHAGGVVVARSGIVEGTYTLRGIPPGSYLLRAKVDSLSGPQVLVQELFVPKSAGKRYRANLELPPPLSASVAIRGASDEVTGLLNNQLTVRLQPAGLYLSDSIPSSRRTDTGEFNFAGLDPAEYGFQVANLPPGLYVITAVDRVSQARGDTIALSGRGGGRHEIDIVVDGGAATVSGTVLDAQGRPAGESVILLIPQAQTLPVPSTIVASGADRTGGFVLSNIRPGAYTVLALPRAQIPAVLDGMARSQYPPTAKRLSVAAGERTVQELRLSESR